MTILVAWLGVDSRSPASLYVATDSRISWGPKVKWDSGRKIFAYKSFPDLVGYCGDVLFPSQAISEVIEATDLGVICSKKDKCEVRFLEFEKNITTLLVAYPKSESGFDRNEISIFYAGRNGIDDFHCWVLTWRKESGWEKVKIILPHSSAILCELGSPGAVNDFKQRYRKYLESDIRGTSRSIFSCFASTLKRNTDPTVGGPPQLAGLYRKGTSKIFGIIHDSKLSVLGLPVSTPMHPESIEWRNEQFEICDGATGKIKAGAQRQPDPLKNK